MNLRNLKNKNVSEVPASLFCLELQHALSQAGPVALLSSPQAGLQIRISFVFELPGPDPGPDLGPITLYFLKKVN
jgi:hypothetical protein